MYPSLKHQPTTTHGHAQGVFVRMSLNLPFLDSHLCMSQVKMTAKQIKINTNRLVLNCGNPVCKGLFVNIVQAHSCSSVHVEPTACRNKSDIPHHEPLRKAFRCPNRTCLKIRDLPPNFSAVYAVYKLHSIPLGFV